MEGVFEENGKFYFYDPFTNAVLFGPYNTFENADNMLQTMLDAIDKQAQKYITE